MSLAGKPIGSLQSGSGVPPLRPKHKQQRNFKQRDAASTLSQASQGAPKPKAAEEGVVSHSALGFDCLGNALPASAITENELPKGWRWVRVRTIGNVQLGRQRAPKHHSGANMRPYLRVANVFEDRIDLSDVLTMNFTPREFETFALRTNDVLLNEGQSLHLVGRPALYRDELPGACFQNTLVRFRPGPEVDPKFALTIFRGYMHTGKFQKIARWTTNIAHLGAQRFADMPFPLPPLPEQRRIVAEIEKQFTRLEAGVAALRRVQANLKRYRAAVLKAACEGKLVPAEAQLHTVAAASRRGSSGKQSQDGSATFETGEALLARILTERRKHWMVATASRRSLGGSGQRRGQYKEPDAPDTENLPDLPPGWTWASLDQILGLMRNGISAKPDVESGLPILRISAVRALAVKLAEARYLNAEASDYPDYALTEGDLLFTRYNGNPELVGVCGVVPTVTAPLVYPDKLIRCKVVPSGALPDFVAIMANVGASRNYLAKRVRTTAGQAGISGGDLKGLPIPLAPLTEQTRIVAEVERRLSVVQELESLVTANLQRATRLRQSILQKAFTGELC